MEAVLDDLGDWVRELAPDEGAMGRPARRFAFRADAGYVMGVDAGANKILVSLADLNGDVVATERVQVEAAMPASERLAHLERAALACADGFGLARSRVLAVGVGTAGIVDRSGRVSVSTVLPGWTGIDLAGHAGRWFGCHGMAGNDANLAALAEHWRGGAQHVDDVVYVLVGRRIRGGVLLGGALRAGRTGAAGEVGALAELGWQEASFLFDEPAEVFAAARAGSAEALAAVELFARKVALGTAALVLSVDPELVVFGGGYARAGDLLLPKLRQALGELCLDAPEVAMSRFGDESVALGGVRLALGHVESQVLGL